TTYDADLTHRGGGGFGGQRGAHVYAVDPVTSLRHQRDRGLTAAAEEDRVDRHAVWGLVLVGEDRALLGRRTEAAGRVAGPLVQVRRPVLAVPVDQVRRRLAHALPPDVAVIGTRDVGEQRVALGHGAHRVRVGLVVGARGHTEQAVLRVHRVQPAVLAEPH